MQMIDALDRYPKALKEALSKLNSTLYLRCPKDPPPPRRSKRTSDVEELETPKKSKKGRPPKQAETTPPETKTSTWSNIAASLEGTAAPAPIDSPPKSASGDSEKPKKKREPRNIGGWISPAFSAEVDRSWLEREKALKNFDLSSYAPQVGDTVLYVAIFLVHLSLPPSCF